MSTAQAISEAISFVALIFLGVQVMHTRQALKESTKAHQQEWERQRRKAAIEASVSTAPYREALKGSLPWNDRDVEEMARFFREANDDYTRLYPVREYLNHLEDIAVGVKQGVFDLDTISILEGSRIIDVVASYKPYIERVRQEFKRPAIYNDVEDLAEIIKAHRQSSSMAPSDPGQRTQVDGRSRWQLKSRFNFSLRRPKASLPGVREDDVALSPPP